MQQKDYNAPLRNLSALVDFSNLINSSLDINFTLNNLLLTCFGKFHTTRGAAALTDSSNILHLEASKGIKKEALDSFPKVKLQDVNEDAELKAFLGKNNMNLVQPIISSNGEIGLLMLGERIDKKEYSSDDKEFIKTLLNIASTAIENARSLQKLKQVNRDLDSKVNQLSSLFDLSKEFSGILEVEMVGKLLVFSIIGQLLVSKYAVLTCDKDKISFIENKFPEDVILKVFEDCQPYSVTEVLKKDRIIKEYPALSDLGIELVIPMKIKSLTKGLILLGERRTKAGYSQSDIEFVSSVGGLAIISIENAHLFEETLEKQRLEKDLELARNIQKNLLPKKVPKFENFQIAAYNNSARQVGGDYYDIVQLDENNTLFAVADVSGKGVQAALLMANLQAFLKSICKQNLPLDESTNMINDLVSENTTMGSFITFFWGVLNNSEKKLTYVNAGHNPPILLRNSEIIRLKKGGMILGVMETMVPYLSETVQLQTGDIILTFTDGITEAMNIDNEEYSDERLEEFVKGKSSLSAEEFLNALMTDIREFTQGAEQSDDITSLVIKVL